MLRGYIKSLIVQSFVSDLNSYYFAYTRMVLAADPEMLSVVCTICPQDTLRV